MNNTEKTKEFEGIINLGNSMMYHIAQQASNKLDSKTHLLNKKPINESIPEKMIQTLEENRFLFLKRKLGKKLSLDGISALVIQQDEQTNTEIYMSSPIDFRIIRNKLVYYVGLTEFKVQYNNESVPCYEVWEIINNQTIRYYAINVKDKNKVNHLIPYNENQILELNIDYIPVQIFYNNEDGKSDIENVKMWDSIYALNFFSNELHEEWILTRTKWMWNENFDVDEPIIDEYGKQVGTGMSKKFKKRVLKVNQPDGMIQNVAAPLISGTQAIMYNQAAIDFIEDKILKYTFSTRDTNATGGNNKQTTEIKQFNSPATEYLELKKDIREHDFKMFYKMLAKVLGEEIDISTFEIQLTSLQEELITPEETKQKQPNPKGNENE